MYNVHTKIGRYEFVHTATTLNRAKIVRQLLIDRNGGDRIIAYITDANGERV